MKSERVPLRWLVVRCLVVWLGLLLLFGWVGCATFLAVAKFSSTFCFVRNNLEHFLALSFCAAVRKRVRERGRECGPQAETPNTSHIWIYVMPLIGCCADADAAADSNSNFNFDTHFQAPQPQPQPQPETKPRPSNNSFH